jgi:methylmalonyl-CoA epimerase
LLMYIYDYLFKVKGSVFLMGKEVLVNRWTEVTQELLKEHPEWKDHTLEQVLENATKEKMTAPKKIDHIGIAVRSIDEVLPFYLKSLKLELKGIEEVPTQKVRVAFLKLGESKLELLEPLSEDSPIAQFIDKRGEGIHHVALAVDNIEERLNELKNNGVRLIHESPVPGAAGALVAFLHPKSTSGVLYEFCEKK